MTKTLLSVVLLTLMCTSHAAADEKEAPLEHRPYRVEGLPTSFRTTTAAIVRTPEGAALRCVVIGIHHRNGDSRLSAHALELKPDSAEVVQTLFDQEHPEGSEPLSLHVIDLGPDADDELLLFTGQTHSAHQAFEREDGEYERAEPPLPRLESPAITGIDYNNNGRTDLFVSGWTKKQDGSLEPAEPRILLNVDGRLGAKIEEGNIKGPIDSAKSLDLNGDGRDELILFPPTGLNRAATVTRIYRMSEDGPREVQLPLMGYDELIGLSRAHVGKGDLNNDGKDEILMTGHWNDQLGRKSSVSLVYQVIPGEEAAFALRYESSMHEIPNTAGPYVVADMDGDGTDDILLYRWSVTGKPDVVYLRNTGRRPADRTVPIPDQPNVSEILPQFELYEDVVPPGFGAPMLAVDLDGDGRTEVLFFHREPLVVSGATRPRE